MIAPAAPLHGTGGVGEIVAPIIPGRTTPRMRYTLVPYDRVTADLRA
jgi:hypothetical protein